MGTKEKLIQRLKSNPRDLTFSELQTALESLGFVVSRSGKTSGSRVKLIKGNVPIILHKPHPRKVLLEYQIKQVLAVLQKEDLV